MNSYTLHLVDGTTLSVDGENPQDAYVVWHYNNPGHTELDYYLVKNDPIHRCIECHHDKNFHKNDENESWCNLDNCNCGNNGGR